MRPLIVPFLLLSAISVSGQTRTEDSLLIRSIYDEALVRGQAYENLRSLCKDVGARLSGSPAADSAVIWGKRLLESYDFDRVWLMPVQVPHWERGDKETGGAVLASGEDRVFHIKTLGGSVTSNGRLQAQVVEVMQFDELEKLGKERLRGKFVFYNRPMDPRLINTGEAYGGCVNQRWAGAVEAEKYGAVGVMIRSVTHKKDRHAHTGSMSYEGAERCIPSIALSIEDAEWLSAALKKRPGMEIYMDINPKTHPDKPSHNVIAEMTGTAEPDQIITIGGHLDSWDVGEGAHDDGAGVVHCIEALRILQELNYKPRYTLRVVLFMNEENGNNGGKTYAAVAKEKGEKHYAAIESDAGGFLPMGFTMDGPAESIRAMQAWEPLLEPYQLHLFKKGWGGVDIGPLKEQGVPLLGLRPDSQRYFDHHHSDTDVFENVHKRELELGAAAMASMVYLIDQYGLKPKEKGKM